MRPPGYHHNGFMETPELLNKQKTLGNRGTTFH